jgi:isopenicillin-N N-acyltransferase like protein
MVRIPRGLPRPHHRRIPRPVRGDRHGRGLIVEAGQIGRHGYNESGLALHANGLSGGLQNRAAIPSPIWRRRILREWGVSESLDRALETPRPGTTNLLISHRDGVVIDLETTPTNAEVLYPTDGWFVHTNHFIGPVPEPLAATYRPGGESLVRLARAHHLLGRARRNGGIAITDLMAMLRDHVGDGRSLCAHPLDDDPPADRWGTVASVITDLTAGTMLISAGPPCTHDYVELDLAALFG